MLRPDRSVCAHLSVLFINSSDVASIYTSVPTACRLNLLLSRSEEKCIYCTGRPDSQSVNLFLPPYSSEKNVSGNAQTAHGSSATAC